jgi:hypothetical protein
MGMIPIVPRRAIKSLRDFIEGGFAASKANEFMHLLQIELQGVTAQSSYAPARALHFLCTAKKMNAKLES